MAAGSLALDWVNGIKQAKMARVGLAGQKWPISNTPSETDCLLKELDDGAFDDRVFLGKTLVSILHIVVALTHNECTGVCLPVGKHTREVYGGWSLLLLL
jgi:hypothetical protein